MAAAATGFNATLAARWAASGSLLCVGIDPEPGRYPASLVDDPDRAFTFGKAIIDHQAVGFRLAAMATRVETARQMVLHAAALSDAGQPCLMEACMAKLVASEAAEWVCSEAIQTMGGYGYLADFPVERYYRDARVTRIYEGTNDIQHLVILREMRRRQAA